MVNCCVLGCKSRSERCDENITFHTSLTFVLGFWVVAMILYALALGLSAGVAFGYDYGLAEYKTLARPGVDFTVRPRIYVPEVLARRSGDVAGIMAIGDEYQKKTGSNIAFEQETYEYTPPTLWLYEPSPNTPQRDPPSTPATRIVKMYYKVTKSRKMVTLKEEDMYSMTEASEKFIPMEVEPTMLYKTSDIMENLSVRPLIPISKARKLDPTRTSTKTISISPKLHWKFLKPDSTSAKLDSTSLKPDSIYAKLDSTSLKPESTSAKLDSTSLKPDLTYAKLDSTSFKPDSTSAKLDSTSLKPYSTFAKAEMSTTTTVKESTRNLLLSSFMRIFKPKSTDFKWRPTKSNKKFFYKTLAASHRRKPTEDSYNPEMEIRTHRTIVHGKYERLPMRHWDAATRATEPTEASNDDNVYKNIVYF